MKINVQAEGKILSINLASDDTSTTWGGVCKDAVEEHLTKVYPDLLLQRLLQLSPTERLSHYLFRYGDGCATIFRVEWSTASVPGCVRLPLATGYVEVNVVLKQKEGSMLESVETDPHLSVQKPVGSSPGTRPKVVDVDVDLSISFVSSAQRPFPYSDAFTSVVYIREHDFPGCVDTFNMVAADGRNSVLPENRRLPAAAASTANANSTATSSGTKRKTPSKNTETSNKSKSKSPKKKKTETPSKPDTVAKKTAAKSGEGESTKKSPVTRSPPPKKSGEEMIQLYLANKANEEKSDSATPEKSSEKKKTPVKKKSDTAESSSTGKKDKKAESKAADAGSNTPPKKSGKEMYDLYLAATGNKEKSDSALPTKSGEEKKTPSKKKSDTTESSSTGKKDKSSSKKNKKTKAADGESAKKPAAVEEGEKSAKKKTSKPKSKESDAVADTDNKASKKKRKAPTDGESSDAVKSPRKKKAKTSDSNDEENSESLKKSKIATKGDDIPSEPAKGFPDGWTEKHYPRQNGKTYTVWFSPGGYRFDTKKGAKSFIDFFEQTNDEDEGIAFDRFKEEQKKEQRVKNTSKVCKSEGCSKLAQKGGKLHSAWRRGQKM